MVVSWTQLLNMLRLLHLRLQPAIHTQQPKAHAYTLLHKVKEQLLDILMFQLAMLVLLKPLFRKDQSLLPQMLVLMSFNITPQVYLPLLLAVHLLITVSLQLVMELTTDKNISLLKTNGVQLGANKDISRLVPPRELTFVVSFLTHHSLQSPPPELIRFYLIIFWYEANELVY